jgi:flagellar basal body-associated protein FliL
MLLTPFPVVVAIIIIIIIIIIVVVVVVVVVHSFFSVISLSRHDTGGTRNTRSSRKN